MNDREKTELWLRPARFAIFLGAFVAAQFPLVILGAQTFFFRDYGFFGYPLAGYHREAFWQGEIPFWNPYNNAGLPFLAQWNTMVLYPGSLIYLLLPMPWSLGIFCLAHQYLAGLGMYFLGRDSAKSNLAGAVAGMAFAFGGLLLCSLKWPNNIAAFGLMPWVVWRCARALAEPASRRVGFAALAGGAQMLSGAPEVILLTWAIIGALGLGECAAQRSARPALALIGIVALVSMIAAAQLLPFFDLLKLSQRTARFAGSDWPMPIWGWANFFVPLFGTFPSYHGAPAQPDQYWTSTYYVPLGAVLFAALSFKAGWRARLLAAVALIGAVMALGESGLLYKSLRHLAPALGFMRFPIKFVVLPIFILPWLAAYGIALARENKISIRTLIFVGASFAIACLALVPLQPEANPSQPAGVVTVNAVGRIVFLALFLFGFVYFGRQGKPALQIGVMMAALWLDGRTHAPEQNPTAANWVFERGLPEITNPPALGAGRAMIEPVAALKLDHLMRDKPEEDIGASRLALFCNANLIDGIPKVDGFFSLYVQEMAQLVDLMYASTNRNFPGLEKALCVSHRTAPGKTGDWLDRPRPPWIHGGQQAIYGSRADILQGILDPAFNPTETVYLPESVKEGAEPDRNVEIKDILWRPHRIEFTVITDRPGWVVISQAFHPGWRAKADNEPLPIQPANYAFQAIFVSKSNARIRLDYSEANFAAACAVSALGLALGGILLFPKAQRP